MRILMMGTGPFAVPTFEALLTTEHSVVGVVTRPDHGSHSRKGAAPSPMRAAAAAHGLTVFDPEDVNASDSRDRLARFGAELFVVCDYGQILSSETLSLARLGGINLHGSLLPKYRGAAPINWALLNCESETGVTVIHMTPRLDGGPCLARRSTPIGDEESASDLESRLSRLGIEPVFEAIALLGQWDGRTEIGERQDKTLATKAPRLKKTDGDVNWQRTARQIVFQVRALKPWPGTFSHWLRPEHAPVRLILDHVSLVPQLSDAQPGTVVSSDGKHLWIATGDGVLSLDRVQPAGKRPMEIAEFLRGHRLQPGDRFGSVLT